MDVQYGKTEGDTQYPVFGIAASDEDLDTIRTTLKKKGIEFEDISEDDDVRFRMIHYQAELCEHPLFVHIEFPERAEPSWISWNASLISHPCATLITLTRGNA